MFTYLIENEFRQYDKEAYIATRITKRLLCEDCTQLEYRNILKIVEERILGKSIYENLECEE